MFHIMLDPKFSCPIYSVMGPKLKCSMLCWAESYHTLYNGNKSCHIMGIFLENSCSGILIFWTSKGNENWFEKLESLRNRVKLLTVFNWGAASHQEVQKTEGSRDLDCKSYRSTCVYFNSEWIYSTDWYGKQFAGWRLQELLYDWLQDGNLCWYLGVGAFFYQGKQWDMTQLFYMCTSVSSTG